MARKLLILTVSALALAGCNSSNGSAVRAILLSEDVGSAAQALEDGETLETTSATSATHTVNFDDNTSASADSQFGISTNANGGVDVTVNGVTTSFAAADATQDGFGWRRMEADGDVAGVFSWNGPAAEVIDPDDPNFGDEASQVWEYFVFNDADQTLREGFAVVGAEPTQAALDGKTTATYRGYAAVQTREEGNIGTRNEFQAGTSGARAIQGQNTGVSMMADFDAGTMSGEITGVTVRTRTGGIVSPQTAVNGSITMNEADITGNFYEGTLTGSGDLADLGDNPTYSGRFFGETAQETAGAISSSGTDAVGSGFFRAFEQP